MTTFDPDATLPMRSAAEKSTARMAVAVKAREIFNGMNKSEQHGVKFGLFPAGKMEAATREGFDGHALALALMECAR